MLRDGRRDKGRDQRRRDPRDPLGGKNKSHVNQTNPQIPAVVAAHRRAADASSIGCTKRKTEMAPATTATALILRLVCALAAGVMSDLNQSRRGMRRRQIKRIGLLVDCALRLAHADRGEYQTSSQNQGREAAVPK